MVLFPCSFPSRDSTTAVGALQSTAAAWPILSVPHVAPSRQSSGPLNVWDASTMLVYLLKSDHTTEPVPNAVPFTYKWPLLSQQDHLERLKLSICGSAVLVYIFPFWKWLCWFAFWSAVKDKPFPHSEPPTKIFWMARAAEHVSHATLALPRHLWKFHASVSRFSKGLNLAVSHSGNPSIFPSCAFLLYVLNCSQCLKKFF